MKKQIFKYLKFFIGITIFIFGMIAGIFYFFSKELPPMEDVQSYRINSGSEVYDCNNNLIHVFQMENRRLTSFDKLPSHLVNALITVEDANFYKHWGVDVFAMFRAVIVDLASWNFAQGGSTITQQLARNMFLNLDKKMTRKIKEAMLAVLIERYFTKEEILEIYFNKIYFGDGVYGVETAAHRYFGKTVQDISIAEAALLVGMIQRPNYYSPIKNPKQSMERRNFVLKKMYKSGIISSTQYESALTENIEIAQSRFIDNLNSNYFIDYIRIKLEREYGTEQLFTGAMRIYATIDYDLQVYADSVLNEQYSILENNRGYRKKYKDYPAMASNISSDYLQGGVYAIDPNTGYVKVMIGGRNFNHSKFNRITQAKRQRESELK
ncbi:MAG TPA: transglycosylase domain-containing protein, partial [Candidatus Cloacimonadota bacterium]|nr:transglycosylase domain-containing protein [Candidatus Cloacimonadota bacterium]